MSTSDLIREFLALRATAQEANPVIDDSTLALLLVGSVMLASISERLGSIETALRDGNSINTERLAREYPHS